MRPFAQRRLPAVATLAVVMVLAACTSMTGKPAGEHVDDAQITAAVKTKLAADTLATLSRVGVETNLRTVYLTGVVNHLTIQQRG